MPSAQKHDENVSSHLSLKNVSLTERRSLHVLGKLMCFVRPYRWQMVAALFALVLTACLTLSVGQGIRILIDQGFTQQSGEALNRAIGFILFITVLISIGTFFRFYLVSSVGERVSADIRLAVFNHVITLHPSYFETNGSGDIMARITTDTTLLQSIIGSSLSMAMRSALMCCGAIVMLFATNIKLSVIVLVSVPIILLPLLIYGRRVRKLSRQSQDSVADVGSYAGEAIEQIKTVQSYTRQALEIDAFAVEVEKAFDIGCKRVRQRASLIAGVILIVFSAIAGMLWVGGNDVINGTLSGGDLGAFVFYAIVVASSLATISEVMGELQRAVGASERLLEILEVENDIAAPQISPIDVNALSGELRFDNVTFCYPSRPEPPAIDRLTLTVPKGQVVALVGHSGAGKTTLFELLQRFYDPQQGRVLLGEVDIRDLEINELRGRMALVPQQPTLFSRDVFYNIRYGKPDATEEEVIAAAKKAHAHDFIVKLPQGYRSFLGEKGTRLSGGQRQRIAIARAILKDSDILLLDEATSALDSESEYYVQQALDALMHNRTTVIIAHRLSTIQHAAQIAVLDHGHLIDIGEHQQLLQRCELYQRLVTLQFSSSRD